MYVSATHMVISVSELRIDKLLGRTSRHPAVPQFKLVCAPQQLFLRKRYAVALGERPYNLVIGPARRFVVPDREAEAVRERELLLHRVGVMNVRILLHIIPVSPALPDQMSPVRSRVNQHIVRTGLYAAFNDCL